jgi:hypothetical protein
MGNPAFSLLAGSDKADGPAAVYTGGLYGLFSRYLAERPFSQSLALQTFFLSFLGFLSFFVLGQTNNRPIRALRCLKLVIRDLWCSGRKLLQPRPPG